MGRIKYIDGLRAFAVLAVILFHFGYLPNGYLGVDVFFVISGFLITGLLYTECKEQRFSIKNFYLRRIRRIIPMVSCITILSIAIGIFVMLPDDLENLAESAVATTLFSNNILQAITSGYWNVVNDFKPLMHTWSLGVEEQYYLLYPILFLIFSKKRINYITHTLVFLTMVSLILYFATVFNDIAKFYYLPFRFFELSSGGIIAILLKNNQISTGRNNSLWSLFFLLVLTILLIFKLHFIPDALQLCLVVISTCFIIILKKGRIFSIILENKIIVYVGSISFSLYMWHQLIVAFVRYFLISEITPIKYFVIFIIIFAISALSFHYIENPFRNREKINNKTLFTVLIPVTSIILAISMFLYLKGGIIRDVPELGLAKSNTFRGTNIKYNERIYSYNHDFEMNNRIKALVVGNSFARDFANILLETKFRDTIEISYIDDYTDSKIIKRLQEADIVFYSEMDINTLEISENTFEKIYCVGSKNFGSNNGIFYNYKGKNYYEQRTPMIKGILEQNNKLKKQWGNKFIDLIGYIADNNADMPVFTPNHRFISQDCNHLTEDGAKYFASIIENDNNFILNKFIQ
jgi:peptidoglycan/LPS O-acetylase OafA/YrhL